MAALRQGLIDIMMHTPTMYPVTPWHQMFAKVPDKLAAQLLGTRGLMDGEDNHVILTAARLAHPDALKAITGRCPQAVNIANQAGHAALHIVLRFDLCNAVLINKVAAKSFLEEHQETMFRSPKPALSEAEQTAEEAKAELEIYALFNDEKSPTPASWSAASSRLQRTKVVLDRITRSVEVLLAAGADVNLLVRSFSLSSFSVRFLSASFFEVNRC